MNTQVVKEVSMTQTGFYADVELHKNIYTIMAKYSHSKTFEDRLAYVMVKKGLEVGYMGYLKKSMYKQRLVRSIHTGHFHAEFVND